MPDRITEIDMNKYLVIKTEDIEKFLTEDQKVQLTLINSSIRCGRICEGKNEWPNHLVLNMDDDFSPNYLYHKMVKYERSMAPIYKVKDIAVDLVNAVLDAKEESSRKS